MILVLIAAQRQLVRHCEMDSTIVPMIRAVLYILLAALLAACQERGRLVVLPGATGDNLAFVLSAWSDESPGKLHAVYVSRCIERGLNFPQETERVWSAQVKDGTESPTVGQFAYGKNLAGLLTSFGPEAITPGCYIARAYADFPDPRVAVAVFRVAPNGNITSLSDA
jgi:hypothetical protein